MFSHYRSIISSNIRFVCINGRYLSTEKKIASKLTESNNKPFEFPLTTFVDGIEQYKKLYGDPWVNTSFEFPINDDRVPRNLWGLPLGAMLKRFRFHMKRPKFRNIIHESVEGKKLYESGFILNSFDQKALVVLNSFIVYKELYGDVKVKRTFTVPNDEYIQINEVFEPNPWPRAAWGLRMGKTANKIKDLNAFPAIHDYLQAIGFSFTKARRYWGIENILNAIKVYKSIHGDVKVKNDFIVPKDSRYPEEIHGMKLGCMMIHIRYNSSHYAYDKIFAESGVDFNYPRTKYERVTIPVRRNNDEFGYDEGDKAVDDEGDEGVDDEDENKVDDEGDDEDGVNDEVEVKEEVDKLY